jgi:hypothetical protein
MVMALPKELWKKLIVYQYVLKLILKLDVINKEDLLMNDIFTLDWLKAAGNRAVKTIAQTALGLFTVGSAINEVNWGYILSVSVVAGIYSILMNIVATLPEVGTDGIIKVSGRDPNGYVCQLDPSVTATDVLNKKTVNLTVVNTDIPSQ